VTKEEGYIGPLSGDDQHSTGSHHFLRHPDGPTTVVPVHAGETIGPGLLFQILRDGDRGLAWTGVWPGTGVWPALLRFPSRRETQRTRAP